MSGGVFRSRIDGWIGLLLLAAGAVIAGASVRLMLAPVGGLRWLAPLLFLAGGGLPLWILATTRYAIGQGRLLVLSGPLRWSIPFAEIRAVRRSRAAWSAPALSLDRLRIEYGAGRSCLVSPADRAGFLAALRDAGVPAQALPLG
jgi:hypothetical protein